VREVCIDMDTFYLGIAKECFSEAHIVVDPFHVVQRAFQLTDELRNSLQAVNKKKFAVKQIMRRPPHRLKEDEWKKLGECFDCYPDLKRAWLIAQEVRKIYRKKDWREGCSQLRKTIWYCKQSGIPEMEAMGKTLNRWRAEILNYYISKTTNAYTEGIHTRFELIKRQHCGIRNVERFAKRLMFYMLPFSIITQIFAQSYS
jgi:transposase